MFDAEAKVAQVSGEQGQGDHPSAVNRYLQQWENQRERDEEKVAKIKAEHMSDIKTLPKHRREESANVFASVLEEKTMESVSQKITDLNTSASKSTTLNLNNNIEMHKLTDTQLIAHLSTIEDSLNRNTHITALSFANCGLGNNFAIAFGQMMSRNSTITNVNLSTNKIASAGIEALAEMLEHNKKITILRVQNQRFAPSHEARKKLLSALDKNRTIVNLAFDFNNQRQNEFKQKYLARNSEIRRLRRQKRIGAESGIKIPQKLKVAGLPKKRSLDSRPTPPSRRPPKDRKYTSPPKPKDDNYTSSEPPATKPGPNASPKPPERPPSRSQQQPDNRGSRTGSGLAYDEPTGEVEPTGEAEPPTRSRDSFGEVEPNAGADPEQSQQKLDKVTQEIEQLKKANEQLRRLLAQNEKLNKMFVAESDAHRHHKAMIQYQNNDILLEKVLPLHKITIPYLRQKFELDGAIDCLLEEDTNQEHYDDVDGKFSSLIHEKIYTIQVFVPGGDFVQSPRANGQGEGAVESQLFSVHDDIRYKPEDILIGSILSRYVYLDDDQVILAALKKENENRKLGVRSIQFSKHAKVRYIVAECEDQIWLAFRGTPCLKDTIVDIQENSVKAIENCRHGGLGNLLLTLPLHRFLADSTKKEKPVFFTGHGLGGALAHLYCLEFLLKRHGSSACSIAFGAPYVGSQEICSLIDQHQLRGHFCTVINRYDSVPTLLNMAQCALRVSSTNKQNLGTVLGILKTLDTLFAPTGDTSDQAVAQVIQRLTTSTRALISVLEESITDTNEPFVPFGYYFLISFYKDCWISQLTPKPADIIQHFNEYGRVDITSVCHHNIDEYVLALEKPTVLPAMLIPTPHEIVILEEYSPVIKHVTVDEVDEKTMSITIRGKNLEFLVEEDMLHCEAQNALDWDRAQLVQGSVKSNRAIVWKGAFFEEGEPIRGDQVVFLIPKVGFLSKYELENLLRGAAVTVTTDFGSCESNIWDQKSLLERQQELLKIAEISYKRFIGLINDKSKGKRGWHFKYSKHDIHAYTKSFAHTDLPCMKGLGLIEQSPETVMHKLRWPTQRSEFEPTCIEHDPIEVINENTKVVRMAFDYGSWLNQRDFCILMHWRTLEDKSEIIVLSSVQHDNCPTQKSFVRGRMLLCGWLLEPSGDDGRFSHCTYVSHIDIGGMAFNYKKQSILEKQPILIHNLKSCNFPRV